MIEPLSLIFRVFTAKIFGVPKLRHFTVVKIMIIAKHIKCNILTNIEQYNILCI